MPNWCTNHIVIKGKNAKQIHKTINKELNRKLKNDEDIREFMNLFVPIKYNETTWYDDNIETWGTKWDIMIEDAGIDFNNSAIPELKMDFQSAWSPVNKFLEKLAIKFQVEISNFYYEGGCDFTGVFECNEDGVIRDETETYYYGCYKFNNDWFWNNCAEEYMSVLEDEPLEECLNFLNFFNNNDIEKFTEMYKEYHEEDEEDEEDEDEENK